MITIEYPLPMITERKYREQQRFLKTEAQKLHAILDIPETHRTDRNRAVFRTGAFQKRLTRPFFEFENSNASEQFDMDFANHGTIDLRGDGWEERLAGSIERAFCKSCQAQYSENCGGYLNIKESDETYDELNIGIIEAMEKQFGQVYIGTINSWGDRNRIYQRYTGQRIWADNCGFAVPAEDGKLAELIRQWRQPGHTKGGLVKSINAIYDRITETGGEYFIWH